MFFSGLFKNQPMLRLIILCFSLLILVQCKSSNKDTEHTEVETDADIEAREDSLALVQAYKAQDKIALSITPDMETKMIRATSEDDAADDPAIWIHPTDKSMSLVFGSNKKGGLAAYNLSGEEVAYYEIGNINNVDVVYDYPLGNRTITVLGCTNRSTQGINLFEVDPVRGELKDIAIDSLLVDPKLIDDIYGFCFAVDKSTNKFYAIINGKNGLMQQFEMVASSGKVDLSLARSVQFSSQTEGMVADNELGNLYVGEEGKGIWKLSISPENENKTMLASSDEGNPNISYDVEGLTLFRTGDNGYLVASSQGNFSYAVFDLNGENPYITSFKIIDDQEVDGVEETDGLDIVSDSLSPVFPDGIIVLQDGFNFDGGVAVPQNFKYVRLGKLVDLLKGL